VLEKPPNVNIFKMKDEGPIACELAQQSVKFIMHRFLPQPIIVEGNKDRCRSFKRVISARPPPCDNSSRKNGVCFSSFLSGVMNKVSSWIAPERSLTHMSSSASSSSSSSSSEKDSFATEHRREEYEEEEEEEEEEEIDVSPRKRSRF
jgi:hypothetical protein